VGALAPFAPNLHRLYERLPRPIIPPRVIFSILLMPVLYLASLPWVNYYEAVRERGLVPGWYWVPYEEWLIRTPIVPVMDEYNEWVVALLDLLFPPPPAPAPPPP
jgi:hypothetical protein